jgi:hypothetical protein
MESGMLPNGCRHGSIFVAYKAADFSDSASRTAPCFFFLPIAVFCKLCYTVQNAWRSSPVAQSEDML